MKVKRIAVLSIILALLLLALQPAWAVKAKSSSKRKAQQPKNVTVQTFPVPINKLANYKSLKKR